MNDEINQNLMLGRFRSVKTAKTSPNTKKVGKKMLEKELIIFGNR